MKNNSQNDKIKIIESEGEWNQFLDIIKENFPKYFDKVKKEGIVYHSSNNNYLYGFFEKGKIIGTIGIRIIPERELGIIGYLQVKKEFRRKGISSKLFNKIRYFSENKKCKYLYLAVHANNRVANKIYKHWNFKRVPMIYNIELDIKNNQKKETINSKRLIIKNERSFIKIIDKIYVKYYYLNKIEHFFNKMHFGYLKNNLYTRRISRIDKIIIITADYQKTKIFLILLIEKGKITIETLKEELLNIKNNEKAENNRISIFGYLNQKEIDNLEEFGLKFEIPIETNGYLMEL